MAKRMTKAERERQAREAFAEEKVVGLEALPKALMAVMDLVGTNRDLVEDYVRVEFTHEGGLKVFTREEDYNVDWGHEPFTEWEEVVFNPQAWTEPHHVTLANRPLRTVKAVVDERKAAARKEELLEQRRKATTAADEAFMKGLSEAFRL